MRWEKEENSCQVPNSFEHFLKDSAEISPLCLCLNARNNAGGRGQLPTVVTGKRANFVSPASWCCLNKKMLFVDCFAQVHITCRTTG
jgi:hypothetical protein